MKYILVTGSSGYIGQHLVKLLQKNGYTVFGVDNKPRLNSYLLPKNFMQHDVTGYWPSWLTTMYDWPDEFDAVIHLAALVRVNESVEQPDDYYNTNLNGTRNVLKDFSYKNFIFASTGAAENPISPYALSKRCAEDVVKDACMKYAKPFTTFRFYNVIGSDGTPPTNPDGLFSNLIQAQKTGTFNLFGSDYNTKDGSCVRDYVHVMEICHAIMKAIEKPSNQLENLGHGVGRTVLEMISKYQEVNNCKFEIKYCQRRAGDLECSVLGDVSPYMETLYTFDELMKK
jgi:UDP-glucose 4-epimerase